MNEPRLGAEPRTPEVHALTRVVDKATADYLRQLEVSTDMLRDAAKSFDQTLITLAAGAVALSVTYLRPAGTVPDALMLSWVTFGISLCLALISFKLAHIPLSLRVRHLSLAIRRAERGLSQAIIGNTASAVSAFELPSEEVELERKTKRWSSLVGTVNIAALGAFVGGVVLLIYFVSLASNLPAGKP